MSQGYSGQYEGYMNGHEAAIDQAEMAARGMMQHGRGELPDQRSETPCCQPVSVDAASPPLMCMHLPQHGLQQG